MSYYSEIQYKERGYNLTDELYFERFFGEIKGKILDVGCNVGHFMMFSPDQMVGIDIDADGLRIARSHNYKVAFMDISEGLNFKSNYFDAVHLRHVLEHLTNPLRALKECHRVLKTGGKIVCSTPDIVRCGLKYFYSDYTHLRPFTKASLSKIAYDAGFKNHQILNGYRYPRGSKMLVRKGVIGLKGVLAIQRLFYKVGWRNYKEIILVGSKYQPGE